MATLSADRIRPQVRQTECFIGGQWTPAQSGNTFETINPATEEVIAQVAEGDAEDIDAAVRAARQAFDRGEWSRMDARERGRLMHRLCDLMRGRSGRAGRPGIAGQRQADSRCPCGRRAPGD